MSETKCWLWLSLALGSNSRKITAVLENFDSPEEIYNCKDEEFFKQIEGINSDNISALLDKSTKKVDEVWETCKNKGIRILTFSSPMYPDNLTNIYDPPYVLYVRCKNRINLNNYLKIAMVGTRKFSDYGKAVAKELAYDIAKAGALVISGMAEGVDGAAHEGALSAGSITVAVLGCGVDICYPPFHNELMDKIIENGMVISEFPPGTPPLGTNFPIRNRIITGLCEATVVCEAPASSGALISADCALEQGREVFAVPGNIKAENSEGTNNLIKQGAKIITEANDVLKDYEGLYEKIDLKKTENTVTKNAPEQEKTAPKAVLKPQEPADEPTDFTKNVTSSEQLILDNLMLSPIHIDRLCELTGLSPNIVNSNLTILEMRGLVKSHPGKNFSLKV